MDTQARHEAAGDIFARRPATGLPEEEARRKGFPEVVGGEERLVLGMRHGVRFDTGAKPGKCLVRRVLGWRGAGGNDCSGYQGIPLDKFPDRRGGESFAARASWIRREAARAAPQKSPARQKARREIYDRREERLRGLEGPREEYHGGEFLEVVQEESGKTEETGEQESSELALPFPANGREPLSPSNSERRPSQWNRLPGLPNFEAQGRRQEDSASAPIGERRRAEELRLCTHS